MVSTEGLVPITREFLASYYEKYPFGALSDDVSRLTDQIHAVANDLLNETPPTEGESAMLQGAERQPPHKVDENMWRNREQIEEILYLLDASHWPGALKQQSTVEDTELAPALGRLKEKFTSSLKNLESYQARNAEFIFNTVMTYMPRDFRGTIIRLQKERSERNKQAAVDALISSGGSIHDKYTLLWQQQMERRRQLADLGSATGVYKTLVKYLVGVPEVLLEFIRKINDDNGPMEEQRQRYGPPLYSLTRMAYHIRLFLSLLWRRLETHELQKHHLSLLSEATDVYTSEFERFIKFIGEVITNAPFFITAEDAGTLAARSSDEYKEINVPAGQSHEVSLEVESVNSYIAWDFSLLQGKMSVDIGFSVECTDISGTKTMILPYRRCESDQGNFCTCVPGNYKLVWDNSYSSFFKKVLRYKVDSIPPVDDNTIPEAELSTPI